MKVLTLNGNKLASLIFAFFCTAIIIYVGVVNHQAVVVTATIPETATVALVVEGFGYGNGGTKEFLYSELSFSAVLSDEAPMYEEEVRQIENTGREVIAQIQDIGTLEAEVVYVRGNSLVEIENNLKRVLARAENGESIVVAVELGETGAYAAQAISNITKNFPHIEIVSLNRFSS